MSGSAQASLKARGLAATAATPSRCDTVTPSTGRAFSSPGMEVAPQGSCGLGEARPQAGDGYPSAQRSSPQGGVHFRVWAPATIDGRGRGRRAQRRPRAGGGRFPCGCRHRRATGNSIHVSLGRGAAGSGSRVPLPARGTTRPVRGHRSRPLRLDRSALARRLARGPGPVRDARGDVHAGRHLGGGRPRAAGARPRRHHGRGGAAGRRLRGRLRLGLRRRRTCSRPPGSTAGRTTSGTS